VINYGKFEFDNAIKVLLLTFIAIGNTAEKNEKVIQKRPFLN